jgi:hypothetical protein
MRKQSNKRRHYSGFYFILNNGNFDITEKDDLVTIRHKYRNEIIEYDKKKLRNYDNAFLSEEIYTYNGFTRELYLIRLFVNKSFIRNPFFIIDIHSIPDCKLIIHDIIENIDEVKLHDEALSIDSDLLYVQDIHFLCNNKIIDVRIEHYDTSDIGFYTTGILIDTRYFAEDRNILCNSILNVQLKFPVDVYAIVYNSLCMLESNSQLYSIVHPLNCMLYMQSRDECIHEDNKLAINVLI